MPSNVTWRILATIGLGLIILATLFFFTPSLPNQQNNGFSRKWLPNVIKPILEKRTNLPLEDICGATDHHIFFSTSNPSCLIREDYHLDKHDTIFFPVNHTDNVMSTRHFVIDSPWSYLFINNEPGLVFGRINDSTVQNPVFSRTRQLFVQSIPVSPTTAVIRTFDSLQSKQVFQKINSFNGQIICENEVFENQQDLGFGTGGILELDNANNLLVYVLFYQNQVVTLDTNLNVLSRFNTIDTTFSNNTPIKQARIDGTEKLVPAKARVNVNRNARVTNGHLYVVSSLRADNEKMKSFNRNSVVDIYKLKNGEYLGSFYIPNSRDGRMRAFIIRENRIIVLYNENIAIFSLSEIIT